MLTKPDVSILKCEHKTMTLNHKATKQLLQTLCITLACICSLGFAQSKNAAAQDDPQVACSRQWYDAYSVSAQAMNIEDFALVAALDEGKTIADVAIALHIDPQVVIDALVDAESTLVHEMIGMNCLTAEDAAIWIAGLPAKMREFIGLEPVDPASQPTSSVIFLPILMN